MKFISESALKALPNDMFWEKAIAVKQDITFLAVQLPLLQKPFIDNTLNNKFSGTYAENAFNQIRFALLHQAVLTTNRLFEKAKNENTSTKNNGISINLLRMIVIRNKLLASTNEIGVIKEKIESFKQSEAFRKLRVFRTEALAHKVLESRDRTTLFKNSDYAPIKVDEAITTMLQGLKIAKKFWLAIAGCPLQLDSLRQFWASYADEFWHPIEEHFRAPNDNRSHE